MENKKWLKLFLIIPAILFVLLIAYMIIDKNNGSIEENINELIFDDDYNDIEYEDESDDEDDYSEELEENFDIISVNEFIDLFDENSVYTDVVLIGSKTCPHCRNMVENMEKAQEELYFISYYVAAEEMTEVDRGKIKGLDNFFENNINAVPLLVIIRDGKFYKGLVGYHDYNELISFLRSANLG